MTKEYRLTDWLPTTKKEVELQGWNEVDVVLFSGDAYVDHPSFGAAVIGRLLEAQGLKVALVPQPDWRGDDRDFTKMGKPRLFFAISAGCMDSMVNHYTANKRRRSDDAYTPEGRAGGRPDYATITYCNILKRLYPDIPVVIGGIEASLRRLTHYDYWSDKLMPGILVDSHADLLIYGMGEKPMMEVCERLKKGESFKSLTDIKQTVYLRKPSDPEVHSVLSENNTIRLYSHEDCLKSKLKQAENFRHIEEESNKMNAQTLIQSVEDMELVVNPPFPLLSTEELDRSFDYPYTRLPHPKYKGKTIPAYEMIKFSVNIHRGCFGGCAFCTISAHQGKFIVNRSKASILKEVKMLIEREDFKGYLSDVGGPSANMYMMHGHDLSICNSCKRPSCLHPKICFNLSTDHRPLLDIYRSIDALPGIKKSFIGSGIRYDLLLNEAKKGLNEKQKADPTLLKNATAIDRAAKEFAKELIDHHVSGRLKVAPEHTSPEVLQLMRKPDFEQFKTFNRLFEDIENERLKTGQGGRQQLIPYFISSHPGCTNQHMAELANETRRLNFKLEQVQDFTPTPMTLATEMYYTGINPYTLKPVYTAKTKEEKLKQREKFFWYR
ncbi:MAG: YgiQ family radical SAM protein [Bacteroidales bacterium]|nr:YgiQ family radical SAM protein [Bacteroidales bacterium]